MNLLVRSDNLLQMLDLLLGLALTTAEPQLPRWSKKKAARMHVLLEALEAVC